MCTHYNGPIRVVTLSKKVGPKYNNITSLHSETSIYRCKYFFLLAVPLPSVLYVLLVMTTYTPSIVIHYSTLEVPE